MWANLLTEIGGRTLASRQFFNAVAGPRGGGGGSSPVRPATTPAVVTAKGLIFVHLYAIYEYSVMGSVSEAINDMKNRAMPINTIRLELLGIVLNNEFKSAKECGADRIWATRMHMFRRVNSGDPLDVADDFFPHDGSHFRPQQLETIKELFGLPNPY